MAEIQQEYKVQFYIRQFRGIFKKILVVYLLSILCLCYLFYKINTRTEPVYYAASENGKLKIEGDFKFELSSAIITEDECEVIKKITFELNLDMLQSFNEDEALEALGEKLKQDFLCFSKTKPKQFEFFDDGIRHSITSEGELKIRKIDLVTRISDGKKFGQYLNWVHENERFIILNFLPDCINVECGILLKDKPITFDKESMKEIIICEINSLVYKNE